MPGEEWKEFLVETVDISNAGFLEIKLTSPPDGNALFIGLAKGWMSNGNKRYRSNVTFSEDVADKVISAIKKCLDKAQEIKNQGN